MAIVIDEYGGTGGLVTLADLLEQVFGDLPDETGETEPEILKRQDGSIQLAGRVSIDEVNELFGFGFHSDEAETMAGLVLNVLGRIASVGDEVEINGLRIRVEKVDRFRIATLSLVLPEDKAANLNPFMEASGLDIFYDQEYDKYFQLVTSTSLTPPTRGRTTRWYHS